MKNAIGAALFFLMFCSCLGNKATNVNPSSSDPAPKSPSASIPATPPDRLITGRSVGPVKIGMTVSEARAVLPGLKFERTSDGDGLALIAVLKLEKTLMTLYAGEQDPAKPIPPETSVRTASSML